MIEKRARQAPVEHRSQYLSQTDQQAVQGRRASMRADDMGGYRDSNPFHIIDLASQQRRASESFRDDTGGRRASNMRDTVVCLTTRSRTHDQRAVVTGR